MNGSIFQTFPKFEPGSNLRKFWKKSGGFAQKFGPNLGRSWYYEWVTFSLKIGICIFLYGSTFKFRGGTS